MAAISTTAPAKDFFSAIDKELVGVSNTKHIVVDEYNTERNTITWHCRDEKSYAVSVIDRGNNKESQNTRVKDTIVENRLLLRTLQAFRYSELSDYRRPIEQLSNMILEFPSLQSTTVSSMLKLIAADCSSTMKSTVLEAASATSTAMAQPPSYPLPSPTTANPKKPSTEIAEAEFSENKTQRGSLQCNGDVELKTSASTVDLPAAAPKSLSSFEDIMAYVVACYAHEKSAPTAVKIENLKKCQFELQKLLNFDISQKINNVPIKDMVLSGEPTMVPARVALFVYANSENKKIDPLVFGYKFDGDGRIQDYGDEKFIALVQRTEALYERLENSSKKSVEPSTSNDENEPSPAPPENKKQNGGRRRNRHASESFKKMDVLHEDTEEFSSDESL